MVPKAKRKGKGRISKVRVDYKGTNTGNSKQSSKVAGQDRFSILSNSGSHTNSTKRRMIGRFNNRSNAAQSVTECTHRRAHNLTRMLQRRWRRARPSNARCCEAKPTPPISNMRDNTDTGQADFMTNLARGANGVF